MNIAMLTNNYKPFVAGVPIAVERLAAGLRAQGHTVYIFAPDYHEETSQADAVQSETELAHEDSRSDSAGCTFRFPTTQVMMAGIIPLPCPVYGWLDHVFARLNIDIIHVHHPVLTGNAALRLGKKYHIPVVFTYHTRYEQYIHYAQPFRSLQQYVARQQNAAANTPDNTETSSFTENTVAFEQTHMDMAQAHAVLAAQSVLDFTRYQVVQQYLNTFVNHCDLVFAPTQTMADYLQPFELDTPIQVLPTGLSSKAFDIHPESAALRKKYLPDEYTADGRKRYLFCTVSRMAKEKNLDFMLRALAHAKVQAGDIFRVLMIGDGPHRKALESLAQELGLSDTVIFTGSIPNDQVSVYHQACDLFLFSSQSETQGIVLLEAFASSLPALAIAATGTSDLIVNGINGILTDADETEWAEKLVTLMDADSNPTMKQMGIAARETALEYEETRIAGKAADAYRQAIRTKAAAPVHFRLRHLKPHLVH